MEFQKYKSFNKVLFEKWKLVKLDKYPIVQIQTYENPIYDVKLWTEICSIEAIDDRIMKLGIEISIVEHHGKQGLIRTIPYYHENKLPCWDELICPCIYDKITPLLESISLFMLEKDNKLKLLVIKSPPTKNRDDIACFEFDVGD